MTYVNVIIAYTDLIILCLSLSVYYPTFRSPGLFSLIDSITSPNDAGPDQDFPSQSESSTEVRVTVDTCMSKQEHSQGGEAAGI